MTIGGTLNALFDVLLGPFATWPAWLTLIVASLATALVALVIFRATSNGPAVAAVKRQIYADLLEMRLFNSDLAAMLRAERDILRHNARYLRLSAIPMLCAAIPLAITVGQLQCRFGYTGAPPGLPVVVAVDLKSSAVDPPAVSIGGPGLRPDAPGAWFPGLRQIAARVVPTAPGDHLIEVHVGAETYTKTLHASSSLGACSTVRPSPGILDQLVHPCEPPLPASSLLAAIRVSYPAREFNVLGWRVSWLPLYLAESMIFALALRRPLGVEI